MLSPKFNRNPAISSVCTFQLLTWHAYAAIGAEKWRTANSFLLPQENTKTGSFCSDANATSLTLSSSVSVGSHTCIQSLSFIFLPTLASIRLSSRILAALAVTAALAERPLLNRYIPLSAYIFASHHAADRTIDLDSFTLLPCQTPKPS